MDASNRRFFRIPVRLAAYASLPFLAPQRVVVADVSLEGLSLVLTTSGPGAAEKARRFVPAGAPVQVQVTFGGTPMVLDGRVAWTRQPEGDADLLLGLTFDAMDAPSRKVFRGWLLKALRALQGAAQHAMLESWDDAAESLETLGIADAEPPLVNSVLRYAAASGAGQIPGRAGSA